MTRKSLLSGGAFLGFIAAFQLLFREVTGPFTGTLLYGALALGIGCCIASEIIAFRDRTRRPSDEPAPLDQPNGSEVEARPEWAGDPESNRRRLIVILVIFAMFGLLAAGFVLMQ